MIRHCVLIRFRPDVPAAERDAIHQALAALESHLTGFLGIAWGPNASPEGLGQGFDHGFIVDFADAGARDAYLVDPGHQAVGARIVAAAEGGIAGILVFDLAMP